MPCPWRRAALVLALALLALIGQALATRAWAAGDALRVGSKRFTESYILAEVLAQQAAPALAEPPELRQGLGNTAIVYEALRTGAIDVYVEYTGTIALEILKGAADLPRARMREQLAPLGLGLGPALGFNDGYALAMRATDAERLGIGSLSDLAGHPELRLGLSNEFLGRADGWAGLAARYALPQRPTGLDHGIAYEALAAGQIDVMDIYTTDAKIDRLGLRVLRDDQGYFPRYDAVVLYRLGVPERFPQGWAAIGQLAGRIDEHAMIDMNARAELNGEDFASIARGFLAGLHGHAAGASAPAAGTARGLLAKLLGPDLARLTWQHLMLVVVSVGAATLIALPLGVAVYRRDRWRALVLGASGLMQTVPSLALLAILIWLLGRIGVLPALVALTLYSILPIVQNTVAGLSGVPRSLCAASRALGMTDRQTLRYVQLPLALPTLIAGVRIATTIAIGTATIAAFIGAGGYGERIVTGLAINDSQLLLAGAIPAAGLALLSEGLFELVQRLLRRRRGGN